MIGEQGEGQEIKDFQDQDIWTNMKELFSEFYFKTSKRFTETNLKGRRLENLDAVVQTAYRPHQKYEQAAGR